MDYAVVQLCQFGRVPAVGGAHEVAGDALQAVDGRAAALGARLQVGRRILVAAVHAAVAVMVHGAISDVVAVHQIHDVADGIGVVRGVAVDFHIEDVAAAGKFVIGRLYLCLVARRAMVVHRHMVGVRVVDFVGDAGQYAECLAVFCGEFTGEAFGGSGQDGEVVFVFLGEFVGAGAHVAHDAQSERLGFVAFAVVLADERHKALCQTDEAYAQRAVVDYALHAVVGTEHVGAVPQLAHHERELLGEGRLLEVEAVVELACGDVEHIVKAAEEGVDALLLVADAHALDGYAHDVHRGEAQIAAADGCLFAVTVLEDACAAAHRGQLVLVALGVVGTPFLVLIEGGVEVYEVGEEAACRHLACKLVEVVVAVLRQIAHAAFFLPYLYGENGRGAVAYALVGAVEEFADDAAALGAGVGAVVDGGEHHLVAAARVDGVHVVYERLHGLVHTAHGAVDGVVQHALFAGEAVEIHRGVVVKLLVVQVA